MRTRLIATLAPALLLFLALPPGGRLLAQSAPHLVPVSQLEEPPWGEQVLKRGQWGAGVFQLQRLLMQLGLMSMATGRFGELTEEAVKKVQAVLGLDPDGVVGPETTRALFLFAQDVVYEVAEGDSLWTVARRFGLNMNTIMWENNVDTAQVRVGQRLVLPGLHRYRVVPGDTLSGLAQRFDTTVERLTTLNARSRREPLRAGEVLLVPTPEW